jgi:hypothetical protein
MDIGSENHPVIAVSGLESPETAITGCLLSLKSLPAIQEIFTVNLNGGVRSLLNLGKAERVENVKSVKLIKYVLFNFHSHLQTG